VNSLLWVRWLAMIVINNNTKGDAKRPETTAIAATRFIHHGKKEKEFYERHQNKPATVHAPRLCSSQRREK